MTIDQLYHVFVNFPLISTDTRQVRRDSLFFALKGDNFNGNDFAATALERGSAFAIVDDPKVAVTDQYICVEDVLATLQQLAAVHRQKLALPIIAITGTNGKTTTKELTAAVLGSGKRIEYTRGNLNNHIGLPLTLLSMSKNTEMGIVEMGANHPGEIEFLCRLADPDFGLITNIGKAHLEGFGDFEGVIRTKSELFRYLEAKGGVIFINGDNAILTKAAGHQLERISYGVSASNWMRGDIVRDSVFLTLSAIFPEGTEQIQTHLTGDYNFENVLAAVTIGRFFNIERQSIVRAIENYVPSNNRSQLIKSGNTIMIMDAYNANPSSMEASISNFIRMEHGRKLLILGDMLELGSDSASEHQKIIDFLTKYPDYQVYLVGEHFGKTRKPGYFRQFTDTDELLNFLKVNSPADMLILVKGSHGMRLDRIRELIS